jgi:hypothetical protein
MDSIDRVFSILAGVMSVAAFVATILRHDFALWALPFGIAALFVGLVSLSLVIYRAPW